ncbi:helix-hairpin-helix domain-containing protein [Actinoplanes sp. HUAS TT8]|uniref:helix-hairpin-helix domain-containing protein n=1 Tax=Actinoplanes sp. HUAS TT8 TaxID=3447453 RepID=UPI003F526C12
MVAWFIGQSIVFILLSFLVGVVVGRLTVRRATPSERVSGGPAEKAAIVPMPPEKVTVSQPVETVAEVRPELVEKAVKPKPRPRKAAAPVTEKAVTAENPIPAEKPVAVEDPIPAPIDEPAPAPEPEPADELERIEGIGPKMADALRAAGLRTFDRLATADAAKRRAINAAGLTFAPSLVTWSRQARLLADGNEEAFNALTARLIAGRETTPEDDDLERVEGIGPMMATALRAAGIRTYRQLAKADDNSKRQAVLAAGMNFAPSLVTWSRQAQLLADGNEEAFNALTTRLVAGRDTEAARAAAKIIDRDAEATR